MPFAFHFLNDKRGEKVLYIVMLPHLSDISRIEVQAEDQYKLKVNTKRRRKGDTLQCLASSGFSPLLCVVCSSDGKKR